MKKKSDGINLFGLLFCGLRFIFYWFRFPTGEYVSGHFYEEQQDGSFVCLTCKWKLKE